MHLANWSNKSYVSLENSSFPNLPVSLNRFSGCWHPLGKLIPSWQQWEDKAFAQNEDQKKDRQISLKSNIFQLGWKNKTQWHPLFWHGMNETQVITVLSHIETCFPAVCPFRQHLTLYVRKHSETSEIIGLKVTLSASKSFQRCKSMIFEGRHDNTAHTQQCWR